MSLDVEAQMSAVHRAREARRGHAYRESSARRLAAVAAKKMRTAFIGALARFEAIFGPGLWGQGRPSSSLTAEQKRWREAWEACRTEVLDHGNAQLRALEKELSEYDVQWRRHHLHLPAIPQTPNDRSQS